MDLGIAGRKAIVCASSRGLGRACATALAEAGCEVVINGRDRERLAATAAELRQATGAKIIPVAADVASRRRAEGAVRRLPRAGYPGQQQCRPAVPRLPRARPAKDARRRRRQHDRGRRADPESDRSDDRQKIRPHRQHHLGIGEDADRRARSVLRRPRRPDRLLRRRRPQCRRVERHHQFPAARRVRDRSLRALRRDDDEEERHQRRSGAGRARRRGSGAADRRPRRVRRGLRVPLLGAGRLYHRPEPAD